MAEEWIKDLDKDTAVRLCGPHDRNLRSLKENLGISFAARGGNIRITGEKEAVQKAGSVLRRMIGLIKSGNSIPVNFVEELADKTAPAEKKKPHLDWAKSKGQRKYVEAMASYDIVCCIGPAGTGKTYLAVKKAVHELREGTIKRLVLCRPAVEAGEKLGFLPGDFHAKVHPYLRPLYDALNDILDYDQVKRYLEREVMEVIPLAYMRGRTLNNAFIILDEGQNTTPRQMKMFLTRMGQGSKIVVTGDITQIDLEKGKSGLVHAWSALANVEGIGWVSLTREDVVRHPLVSQIVEAYKKAEEKHSSGT